LPLTGGVMRPLLIAVLSAFAVEVFAAPVSPPLVLSAHHRATNEAIGTLLDFGDRDPKFSLFVPREWAASTNASVSIHFHTAASTIVRQHARRGAREPLAVVVLGSGSAAYANPFADGSRFRQMIGVIETELRVRAAAPVRITSVDISSFSAGYGAVREILKVEESAKLVRSILLLDSLYGGLEKSGGATNRTVLTEHVNVWLPFARAAVNGTKTFLITTSDVPTPSYASTKECADALVQQLGLKFEQVPIREGLATNDFALRARADAGNFHAWSYTGTNAPAHMAHVHHLAEMWKAIQTRNVERDVPNK
jgi:hypothetical protein